MRKLVRTKIAETSSYVEIIISIILLLAASLSIFQLVLQFINLIQTYSVASLYSQDLFDRFLSFGIQLIIVVEFVKMLAKHTPGSTVEVLLVVVAKRIVVDKLDMVDVLYGIIAIALLFMVKKYIITSERTYTISGETIHPGNLTINEFNKLSKNKVPTNLGDTIEEVILNEFHRTNRVISIHETLKLGHVTFAINEIKEHLITKVEVIYDDEITSTKLPIKSIFKKH